MLFNSRDLRCKSPYGAVPSGTAVTFRIRPERKLGVRRAFLHVVLESSGEERRLPLEWEGLEAERDVFSTVLQTEGYTGLIWYAFPLECRGGSLYIRREGLASKPGADMQLTVFDPSLAPVPWFSEGIVYQIFPDRFHRTFLPAPPEGKRLHENWNDQPEYEPRADPVTNRQIWNSDFFGGSLAGICAKLDCLRDLGVTVLYLNPVFQAFSSHRYDTGDYEQIDPLLGDWDDFRRMCQKAHALGMRVVLDGVFNHTGSDSRYFNREGRYPELGAYQSPSSPYYDWYTFQQHPDIYTSWWGIDTLPSVNELVPSYIDYIIEGENSIVKRWLRAGADGWRLDVADELPDPFIQKLYRAAKAEKPDAIVIGEVWEDASNKISYSVRRRHLHGGHLDGVMSYPFRNAVISYLLGGNAADFVSVMEELRENYPPGAFLNSMNFLGTHDTPRILTVLAGAPWPESKQEKAACRLTGGAYDLGKKRLMLASLILFAFPGAPTIYYGDEAGVSGFDDPFNRTAYPWGKEDKALVSWYRRLAEVRHGSPALRRGDIRYYPAPPEVLAFSRTSGNQAILAVTNAKNAPAHVLLPWAGTAAVELLTGRPLPVEKGQIALTLEPLSGCLIGGAVG